MSTINAALLILVGFAAWTFVEYAVHRWVLHGPIGRKFHAVHHRNPDHHEVQVPMRYSLMAAAVLFSFIALIWGWVGLWYGAGLYFGYWMYVIIHEGSHGKRGDKSKWGWYAECHKGHHDHYDWNYGVVTMFWDRVFRTYVPPGETPRSRYGNG